jgi:two-component system, LytTR family, response regulator
MLRAIIIDDEEAGIDNLRILASRNDSVIRVVASTLKPEEGIIMIENYKPDLVFLDISMPTMSGFDLLAKLNYRNFKLVFTTAYKEYAIEAIKNKAFDYLLKPISHEDFKNCLTELNKERHGYSELLNTIIPSVLELQVKDGIIYVNQKDIVRLESSRSYTEFHLDNKVKHVVSRSLVEFEAKLNADVFYRCHKSHIINLQKVQKFVSHNGFFALMTDGSMADISRSQKDIFFARLKQVMTGFKGLGSF